MRTTDGEIQTLDANNAVEVLAAARSRHTVGDRISLCLACLEGIWRVAANWAAEAARAKGCPENDAVIAEDLLSGPTVIARYLQLAMQTLRSLNERERPVLPGRVRRDATSRLLVPVFPADGLWDSLTFMGLSAVVRMLPEIQEDQIHGNRIGRAISPDFTSVSAVLGAGNVSSIPALDSLDRILFCGARVVLKMNPVNAYLADFLKDAFRPLIDADLLRIVTGGADVGEMLVRHDKIDHIHITGSRETHDRIVWGPPDEQEVRRQQGRPCVQKPVTSELGNVTPWIIVPGEYSARQLRSQAEHIAASITNNASFNCLATKVIVTWDRWGQRDRFLQLVQEFLDATPRRPAYYPGAIDRYRRFTGKSIEPDDKGTLPWTLLTDQNPDDRPELFREESFVCVCAETKLPADSEAAFPAAATEFVNERVFGSLCASVTVPRVFERAYRENVADTLNSLRYGSVCVNQWSGLAYGLVSPPWGAYPGETLQDVRSGVGHVHNTYLLHGVEKTILRGPLINFPHPIWFPSHRRGRAAAEGLLRLYLQPSMLKLPALFANAMFG